MIRATDTREGLALIPFPPLTSKRAFRENLLVPVDRTTAAVHRHVRPNIAIEKESTDFIQTDPHEQIV